MKIWDTFYQKTYPFKHKMAVSDQRGGMTFQQLFQSADEVAQNFSGAGIGPGDVVALALPNRTEFIIYYLALCKLAAVTALVSTKYQKSELISIIKGLKPLCFITSESQIFTETLDAKEMQLPLKGRSSRLKLVFTGNERKLNRLTNIDESHAADVPALIKLTSGSTGVPKGILLSEDNVLAEAHNIVTTLDLMHTDVVFAAVPIFHSYGFDLGVLSMLYSGAHLILRDGFIPRKILQEIQEQNVTLFLGTPSMYGFFIESQVSVPPDFSRVRFFISCTAPLASCTIDSFYHKFGAIICEHYGSSESGAATIQTPEEVMNRRTSVGRPMHNVEIAIVDSDHNHLPPFCDGEVVISSRAVARTYLMGKPADRNPLSNGMFMTGELGFLDHAGFLYLKGRLDKLINVGGLKVSPQEIVEVLESFPAVREAAVVGVSDRLGNESVYALVTVKEEVLENEILEFCRAQLAEYKVPRRIEIRHRLPKGPSGKIRVTGEDFQL